MVVLNGIIEQLVLVRSEVVTYNASQLCVIENHRIQAKGAVQEVDDKELLFGAQHFQKWNKR